jgi:hypothetical protein
MQQDGSGVYIQQDQLRHIHTTGRFRRIHTTGDQFRHIHATGWFRRIHTTGSVQAYTCNRTVQAYTYNRISSGEKKYNRTVQVQKV